ncbi:MAG: ferritin-like domain-containing protein [Ignavibacteria bacterium]|nr:ferritin-like domain-containing protein [Ignavibacteria bacterium]
MPKVKNLQDFLIEELKDIYSAEKQITKALPKMIKAATSDELKEAFQNHLDETTEQINRLEKISEIVGKNLTGKKCKAMEGLVGEGREIIEEEMDSDVRDVALIAAGQKVEHYEIASYGCARTYARLLGHSEVEELLQETLDEEGNANKLLTEISESLNLVAMDESEK